MNTELSTKTVESAVVDAQDNVQVFYWVYVCREHAKGKVGYLAPENCPNCQVNTCTKSAEYIVSMGEV